MKKLYMYMIIIFSIMIIPFNVYAYTVGSPYTSLHLSNNFFNEYLACAGSTYCTKNGVLGNQPRITCDTDICFINFVSFATAQQSGNTSTADVQSYLIQLYGGAWYPCETIGGESTCMIPKNTKLTNYEIKFMYSSNTLAVNLDLNTINVFNSPADVHAQLDNLQQQQAQQNQIVNNTDSSGNATDFNNVVNNATLPNNSHGFDILGSLQNFVSGIEVSGSCNRISVPIPFTNQTLILPCMTTDVYSVHFPEIVVIWQLLVRGLGYYYILVNILKLIKETIDPFNFKLEVMDL